MATGSLFGPAPALAEEEEIERRNEIAVILAGTYEGDEEKSFFTIDGAYQRRLTPLIGVGGVAELVVEGEAREHIAVFPVFFHPLGGLELFTGPGWERKDGGYEFLYRGGTAYNFEFGERYSLSPFVEFDFINSDQGTSHAIVYGVDFGIGF